MSEQTSLTVTEEELSRIHQYTRRPMAAEELYTFTVVLCDNEVDRDYERFSVEALQELAQLFLGKTGIFDHSPKAEYQSARIYDTYLEDAERLTEDGEPYTRLVAKAYLPRSEKTEQLILEIDSGIKKEVSVGCAMAKRTCSVCGADKTTTDCGHHKGQAYWIHGVEKVAHDILSKPTDAYEWSFVAVPAQRKAGVIKRFSGTDGRFDLEKLFSAEAQELTLTKHAIVQLRDYITGLQQQAQTGERYRQTVAREVQKLSRLVQPQVPEQVLQHWLQAASLEDLEVLKKSYHQQAEQLLPLRPQLWRERKEQITRDHPEFQI